MCTLETHRNLQTRMFPLLNEDSVLYEEQRSTKSSFGLTNLLLWLNFSDEKKKNKFPCSTMKSFKKLEAHLSNQAPIQRTILQWFAWFQTAHLNIKDDPRDVFLRTWWFFRISSANWATGLDGLDHPIHRCFWDQTFWCLYWYWP